MTTQQPFRPSRRMFLAGAAGLTGLGLLGASPWRPSLGGASETLVEPVSRSARNGVLETALTARRSRVRLGGHTPLTLAYDGQVPGPTWRVRPGDSIRLRLTNGLDDMTNFHWHGFNVSPSGNSDNVLLHIMPGEVFDYRVDIPTNHQPGFYWYHPHFHEDTEIQVWGGMFGGIVMEGWIDEIPGIAGKRDRLLLLNGVELDEAGNVDLTPNKTRTKPNRIRMTNGHVNPTMSIRPGETQRFRVLNASADEYVLLNVEGHDMRIIGFDGVPVNDSFDLDQILVTPGMRIEFLLRGGRPGRYALQSLPYGNQFSPVPQTTYATLVVEGDPVEPTPFPTKLNNLRDLRNEPIANRHELVFDVDFPKFTINGKVFDENTVNVTAKAGTVDEWHLVNKTDEDHPFHIHVNEFQVTHVNGQAVDRVDYWDTFNIPAFGSFTMRTWYDPRFPGKTVYHCHILFHEDSGMMGIVEIVE